jgi:hypothetical protein
VRIVRPDWQSVEEYAWTKVGVQSPSPAVTSLVTLKDAGTYITKLPKAEHEAPEWQAAMEALILVAENDGPTMFARIGIMRALNRHVERVFNPDRKDHHWGRHGIDEAGQRQCPLLLAQRTRTRHCAVSENGMDRPCSRPEPLRE